MKPALCLLLLLAPWLPARTWTDVRGRTVEGELMRVEAGNPIVSLNDPKTCLAQGWMCVAFDSNTGFPGSTCAINEGMALLTKEWPVLKTSDYAVGGFSGGVVACCLPCAWLVKNEYRVIGAFIGGNNADYFDTERKRMQAPREPYRRIKVLVSSGQLDKNASPEGATAMPKSLKSSGLGEVRLRTHEGGHKFYEPHFDEALTWFVETGEKKK